MDNPISPPAFRDRPLPRPSHLSGSALIAILVSLVTTAAAFAQGTEGPNQKAFQEIDLDVTQGIANRTLPFDVPFILTGEVPSTVIAVRGFLHRPPEPPGGAPQPPPGLACEGVTWDENNQVAVWNVAPPAATVKPSTGNGRTFKLLFPPLDVNTVYCTHFEYERAVSATEAAEFQRRAATIIDGVLRGRGLESGDMTNEQVEALRQQLIAAITANNSGIRAVRGSLFDPRPVASMTEEELRSAQQDLLKKITPAEEPQFQWIQQVSEYQRIVTEAEKIADSIRDHPLMAPDRSVPVRGLLTGPDPDALDILQTGLPADRSALVAGLRSPQTGEVQARAITDMWDVTFSASGTCSAPEMEAVLANLRGTRDFAVRLRAALNDKKLTASVAAAEAQSLKDLQGLVDNFQRSIRAALQRLNNAPELLCNRARAINAVAMNLRQDAREEVSLLITTTGDFAARHPWHFSADVGMAVAPVIGEVFPYVGVNIYFRPVNRDARLSSLRNSFGRRFSLMIGYTWTDNLIKDDQRLGLFTRDQAVGEVVQGQQANSMLVFGAGLRVTDALRLAGGALLFKGVEPNPLIVDTDLQVTPFVSLSWDWDAVGNIRGLGGLLGFGGTPVPVAIAKRDPPPPQPEH